MVKRKIEEIEENTSSSAPSSSSTTLSNITDRETFIFQAQREARLSAKKLKVEIIKEQKKDNQAGSNKSNTFASVNFSSENKMKVLLCTIYRGKENADAKESHDEKQSQLIKAMRKEIDSSIVAQRPLRKTIKTNAEERSIWNDQRKNFDQAYAIFAHFDGLVNSNVLWIGILNSCKKTTKFYFLQEDEQIVQLNYNEIFESVTGAKSLKGPKGKLMKKFENAYYQRASTEIDKKTQRPILSESKLYKAMLKREAEKLNREDFDWSMRDDPEALKFIKELRWSWTGNFPF